MATHEAQVRHAKEDVLRAAYELGMMQATGCYIDRSHGGERRSAGSRSSSVLTRGKGAGRRCPLMRTTSASLVTLVTMDPFYVDGLGVTYAATAVQAATGSSLTSYSYGASRLVFRRGELRVFSDLEALAEPPPARLKRAHASQVVRAIGLKGSRDPQE